jgi:hypothetical protein
VLGEVHQKLLPLLPAALCEGARTGASKSSAHSRDHPTAYGSTMTAMTVESAKNIGIAVAVALVMLMLLSAFVIKKVTMKLLTVVILGGLAFGMWTQRSSLQDCADKVKARGVLGDTTDVTCTFLGSDIKVAAAPVP